MSTQDDRFDGDGTGSVGEQGSPNRTTMASTFRGRATAKSTDELRKARESRASEALKMKDEQLKILSDQNATLLQSLDKIEDEANLIQMEKIAVEQENRSIRDQNFELQSKSRAAETQSKRMAAEVAEKEKQIRILTDQNAELLRLLESEESLTSQLQGEVAEVRSEVDEIRQKYAALLTTAKMHEELATKAAREGQLRAEEIRILRTETEQLKQTNAELKMKTQVEVEALQEQLRVRKEKQYQLLEKLQAQEEAKRQAEDQVTGMEEQLRGLHARTVELETQLSAETRTKLSLEEANRQIQLENSNLFNANKELQSKIEKSEKERLRMEAEARDSAEQLREMAEKVFQLLERLKLAELGKTKAMEALKKKEQDLVALQKKNARLIKEATEEGRARAKAELDIKVLQDQVRVLKKHNQEITQKSKEEAIGRVKAVEECEQLQERLKTMESRLSFLLNKVQADEEARLIQAEDRKKLEAQVLSFSEKCEELQHKLQEMGESNRVIAQAMRLKQEELNELQTKYETLCRELEAREANEGHGGGGDPSTDMSGARPGAPDDIDNVRLNEGRGRFYVEAKSIGGGSLLVLRGRKPLYREWLDKQSANDFLKKAQKTTRFRDMVIEKMAGLYGLLMVEEEDKKRCTEELIGRDNEVAFLQKKLTFLQDLLSVEEDAKRRMLLRYIHAVKEHAMAVNSGSGGVLVLPESNISDEEVHALAALLRNNTSIDELNLRGNNIGDDGARALGAVLAGRSSLRLVDLRGNKISKSAIRILAEALERSERVRHVYVHAGGKIEALGAGRWANPRDNDGKGGAGGGATDGSIDPSLMVTVETICVVDVRENDPQSAMNAYELLSVESSTQQSQYATSTGNRNTNNGRLGTPGRGSQRQGENGDGNPSFQPLQLLDRNISPPKGAVTPAHHHKKAASKTTVTNAISKMKLSSQEGGGPSESAEVDRKRLLEQKAAALREASWQGRSGGLDRSTDGIDFDARESLRLKKKAQRGELPPLSEVDSTPLDISGVDDRPPPSRGNSAPDLRQQQLGTDPTVNSNSGQLVMEVLTKARKAKGVKSKTHSETEKRLFNSPFAQPILRIADGKEEAK